MNIPNGLTGQSFESLCGVLGLKTKTGCKALMYAIDQVQLLDRKQQDYGPRNISDFGELGVIIRANDKVQRLRHLMLKQQANPTAPINESVEDSFTDLCNYGLIGRMVHNDDWIQE